jgi:hypothetical protein
MVDRHFNLRHFGHSGRPRASDHRSRGPDDPQDGEPSFDLSIFDQGELWIGNDGVVYRVALMGAEDRRELAAWLVRNAQHFYVPVLARKLLVAMRLGPGTVPYMTHQSATEWMRGTVLMGALMRGLKEQQP